MTGPVILSLRLGFALLVTAPAALPAPATDQQIEEAARTSFNFRTVLEGRISVTARNGLVTLSGTVPDTEAKALAFATAENIPGVERINNDIIANWPVTTYSDAWIEMKVRGRLQVRAKVNAKTTIIRVANGEVTLSGSAESNAQKDLTGEYAREIDRVISVRNDLVVTPQTNPVNDERIDDPSITSQVRFALLTHGLNNRMRLQIQTVEGAVAITGVASTEAEKALVTELAQTVRGVKSVTNQMSVKA